MCVLPCVGSCAHNSQPALRDCSWHRLPAPLNRTASMLDLAANFRLMAEQSFVAHMKRQRDQLLDFVSSTPGFDRVRCCGCWHCHACSSLTAYLVATLGVCVLVNVQLAEDAAFAQVEHGLKAQLYHLTQLSGSWGDILPSNVYRRAMGHLVDTVLDHFIQHTQNLEARSVAV